MAAEVLNIAAKSTEPNKIMNATEHLVEGEIVAGDCLEEDVIFLDGDGSYSSKSPLEL